MGRFGGRRWSWDSKRPACGWQAGVGNGGGRLAGNPARFAHDATELGALPGFGFAVPNRGDVRDLCVTEAERLAGVNELRRSDRLPDLDVISVGQRAEVDVAFAFDGGSQITEVAVSSRPVPFAL